MDLTELRPGYYGRPEELEVSELRARYTALYAAKERSAGAHIDAKGIDDDAFAQWKSDEAAYQDAAPTIVERLGEMYELFADVDGPLELHDRKLAEACVDLLERIAADLKSSLLTERAEWTERQRWFANDLATIRLLPEARVVAASRPARSRERHARSLGSVASSGSSPPRLGDDEARLACLCGPLREIVRDGIRYREVRLVDDGICVRCGHERVEPAEFKKRRKLCAAWAGRAPQEPDSLTAEGRTCEGCGEKFHPTRSDRKTCSAKCKKRVQRRES
jgi:hypothetical protein